MPLIAVDAMGGDTAPRELVEGAILAAQHGVRVALIGDESQISPLLEGRGVDIAVRHASQVITMDDVPARAIRDKKDASVAVAARMVAAGEADAMVSAGPTGAALASAAFLIGRLPGVSRPGIASIFPTGHVVMDVGANIECKPEHLLQFAVMGAALCTVYQGIENPRVGLLNIGEEASKGRELEKGAFRLMKESAAVRECRRPRPCNGCGRRHRHRRVHRERPAQDRRGHRQGHPENDPRNTCQTRVRRRGAGPHARIHGDPRAAQR